MKLIDPRIYPGWNDLLSRNRINSCFFTSEWAQVLSNSYGYSPHYLISSEKDQVLILIPIMFVKGNITGFRAVSLPFTDFCNPYYKDKSYFYEAISYLIRLGNEIGLKYFELRGIDPKFVDKTYCYYFTHTLDLRHDEKTIFKKFKENAQRNIKKALKQDINIYINNSMYYLYNFYRLNCLTRKRHGLPPQPFKFFLNIYNYLLNKNMAELISAEFKGKIIASSLFLKFGNLTLFKYGASDDKYNFLNANHLIIWKSIGHFKKLGIDYLNMGRTEPENAGLLRYKKSWGAEETIIYYARYSFAEKAFVSSNGISMKHVNKILNKCPLILLEKLGKSLYKYFG